MGSFILSLAAVGTIPMVALFHPGELGARHASWIVAAIFIVGAAVCQRLDRIVGR